MRFNLKNRETTTFKKTNIIEYKVLKLIFGDFSITLLKKNIYKIIKSIFSILKYFSGLIIISIYYYKTIDVCLD